MKRRIYVIVRIMIVPYTCECFFDFHEPLFNNLLSLFDMIEENIQTYYQFSEDLIVSDSQTKKRLNMGLTCEALNMNDGIILEIY